MQQFDKGDFADIVIGLLEKTGADPRMLELEITESMAMNNPDIALRHINRLKEIGCQICN